VGSNDMKIDELNIYDDVIIKSNDEWSGLRGVVDWKHDGMIGVFCTLKPNYLYTVGSWNSNNIIKI